MPIAEHVENEELLKIFDKKLKQTREKILGQMKNKGIFLKFENLEDDIKKVYKGGKLREYLRGFEQLKMKRFKPKNVIEPFIKNELIVPKDDLFLHTKQKPRMIGPRGRQFMALFGVFGHFLEHTLFHSKGILNKKANTMEFAKTMNINERQFAIKKLCDRFRRPVVFVLDGSSFDAHVTVMFLKRELKFYHYILSRISDYPKTVIDNLLRQVENNIKCLVEGYLISVKVKGNRMSGDWNTSLGNCLLMSHYVYSIMIYMGISEIDFGLLDDGDDCLLVVEGDVADKMDLQVMSNLFLAFDQEVKIDKLDMYHSIQRPLFCQQHILVDNVTKEFVLTKKLDRFLEKYFSSVNLQQSTMTYRYYYDYMLGMVLADLHTCSDTPFLYPFLLALYKGFEHKKTLLYLQKILIKTNDYRNTQLTKLEFDNKVFNSNVERQFIEANGMTWCAMMNLSKCLLDFADKFHIIRKMKKPQDHMILNGNLKT